MTKDNFIPALLFVIPARDAGIHEYERTNKIFLKKNTKKYLH
ncbi:hypothetical protein [Wolbachia pipientis]|nr:hypothetical protein [Wolbachia pipientis]